MDIDSQLAGIQIRSKAELRVVGYADDTTSYLRDHSTVPRLFVATEQIGRASRLHLNEEKTKVIAMHEHGPQSGVALPEPPHFPDADHHGRYLGRQIGSRPDPEVTWSNAERQLAVRLHMSCQNPPQLINAV